MSLYNPTQFTQFGSGKPKNVQNTLKDIGKSLLGTSMAIVEAPQKLATFGTEALLYGVTLGNTKKPEYELPSEAMGLKGGWGLLADVALDPLWLLGAPGKSAKAFKLGDEALELSGKVVGKTFLKETEAIRTLAKSSIVKELEEAGFKTISDSLADVYFRAKNPAVQLTVDEIKEISTAQRLGDSVLETLGKQFERKGIELKTPYMIESDVDQLANRTISTYYKEGILPQWVTSSGIEANSLNRDKWVIESFLEAKIPFTDAKATIISMDQAKALKTSIVEGLNNIPGFEQATKGIYNAFNVVPKNTPEAVVDLSRMKVNSINQTVAYATQLESDIYSTVKQLQRENVFGSKAFSEVWTDINAKLLDGTLTPAEASKMSSLLGEQVQRLSDTKGLLTKMYSEVAPELKGFKYGQTLTEKGVQYLDEVTASTPKIAAKVEKASDIPHRGWFRFENEAGDTFVGKASFDGRNLMYFGEKELKKVKKIAEDMIAPKSAETKKIIDFLEKKIANPNYSSYLPKGVVDKIKNGTITLTDVDKKLYKAYQELPTVLNDVAKKRYNINFDLFETDYMRIILNDMQRQAKVLNTNQMNNALIKSDYIQGIRKGGEVPAGWKEIKWLSESTDAKKGTMYFASPDVEGYLNRFHDIMFSNEGVNAIYNGVRGFTSWWKSWTLGIFPAYHARNALDDGFRMQLAAGMSMKESLLDPYKTFVPLLRRASTESLDATKKIGKYTEAEFVDLARRYGIIEPNAIRDIESVSEMLGTSSFSQIAKKGATTLSRDNPLIRKGFEVGNLLENGRRLSAFNASLAKGMTPQQAATLVRRVLFDYGELTQFERAMKNTMLPFYIFFRKSTELYAKEIMANPGVFATMMKLKGDLDPELLYDGEVPFNIPKTLTGGKQYYIDMSNYLSAISTPQQAMDPTTTIFNMINPLFKIPLELATDYDFFKGRQNYEGEMEEMFGKAWKKDTLVYKALQSFRPAGELDRVFFRSKTSQGEDVSAFSRGLRFITGIKINEFDTIKRTQSMQKKQEADKRLLKAIERNKKKIEEKYM